MIYLSIWEFAHIIVPVTDTVRPRVRPAQRGNGYRHRGLETSGATPVTLACSHQKAVASHLWKNHNAQHALAVVILPQVTRRSCRVTLALYFRVLQYIFI